MLSDHLMIPSRNLPYEMILTHLFKHFKINLSDGRTVAPSIDIDCTLLKRMHVGLHAQAPPHPTSLPAQYFAFSSFSSAVDPYAGIITQLSDLSLSITSSTEKILENQKALRSKQQNNMSYVCSSIRYLQHCSDYSFSRHDCPVPVLDAYEQPLPLTSPPFDPWTAPQDPSMAFHPVAEPDDNDDEDEGDS